MLPYLSLDVTQSGVLKSDTGERRGEKRRGSLATINIDNCHSLVRQEHQIWVWILEITSSLPLVLQYDGGDRGSQMLDFLYLYINWILLAPLNTAEEVCGESEATVGWNYV